MIAVATEVVSMGMFLSGGFPLGTVLYYPANALLYPALHVWSLIPEQHLSIIESFAILWLLPFIEFFVVALLALELRQRMGAHKKKNNKQDNPEGNH
jgi:hypothetical protein